MNILLLSNINSVLSPLPFMAIVDVAAIGGGGHTLM